jgi:hypothetical protein
MSDIRFSEADTVRMTEEAYKVHDDYMSLITAYNQLKREAADALRPFAAIAAKVDGNRGPRLSDEAMTDAYMGDLRRAAEVLAKIEERK